MALSKNHELGTFANGLDVNQSTGAVTSISIDTDAVSEGSSNQYFTNERVDDRVNALLQAGSNITLTYDDASNTLTIASSDTEDDLSNNTTSDLAEGTNLYFTNARADARITAKLSAVDQHILPTTDITYDLGSSTYRFRDLYLSGSSIQLGTREITQDNIPDVNLAIAPETLAIQVAAPAAGQDTNWLWTWTQSTLPYARRTITNSNEVNVPLYLQGTYTVNNFAGIQTYGSMNQTHTLYFKWIDGAGTDNLVSWVTNQGSVSMSHPDINGGNTMNVQRLSISVPSSITLPTLTQPSGVSYNVTNPGAGKYGWAGAASGENINIGPLYRGSTYTFNVNAVGHPFYLTTDNGTNFSSGGYYGEYTSGVTNSRTDNGTLTFVVPANAPDTLYYQCGYHSTMIGAITIKSLAVETNNNGNYVIYAQHTQEGHKTPVELRPIPSLVNQMCLVYDASTTKFVPQDLATYVENTPSFENKIREVAGTATLVDSSGQAIVPRVNIYSDSTYLPLVGNESGDMAFATDINAFYVWDGTAWEISRHRTTATLPEATNLYYTDTRVGTYISGNRTYGDITTTGSIKGPATLTIDPAVVGDNTGTVVIAGNLTVNGTTTTVNSNEVNIGDNIIILNSDETGSPSQNAGIEVERGSSTNVSLRWNETSDKWQFTNDGSTYINIGTASVFTGDTDGVSEGSSNLYYTDARFDTRLATKTTANLTEGSNLYFTDARADARIAAATTSDLSEGTNLYYTDARAQAAITGGTGITNTSGTLNLDNTAVSAGNYGSSTAIPVVTIDAQGRITSASTASINTSFTLSDGSTTQTISGGDTLTVAGTGNEVEVAVSATDTLTIGLPNDVTVSNDLTVSGNLIVTGTTTQTGAIISDSNFTGLTNGNTGNATDFGFYGKYVESATTKYSGLFSDASSDNAYRLFRDTQTVPATTVNTNATGFDYADLHLRNIVAYKSIQLNNTSTASTYSQGDFLNIQTNSDQRNLVISNNANNYTSGVNIALWGADGGHSSWDGGIHYTVDEAGQGTSTNNADHIFWSYRSGNNGWDELMRIRGNTNKGRVGIGTSDPQAMLAVHSNSSNTNVEADIGVYHHFLNTNTNLNTGSQIALGSNSNPGAGIYAQLVGSNNEHKMGFQVRNSSGSSTTRMTITGDGNVGIGTTAPDQSLQVKGIIETQATNSTNGWMMYTYTDNTLRFNYNGAGNDEFVIESGGNVGIGTVNPIADLSIVDATSGTGIEIQPEIATGENRITNYNRGTSAYKKFRLDAVEHNFYCSGNHKVNIDSNGKVGIGTTSPAAHLHTYGGSDANLRMRSDSYRSGLFIDKPGTGTVMGSALLLESDETYRLGTAGHYHMAMYQNGTTQIWGGGSVGICIDGSGNVGVGFTSPNDQTSIGYKSLHVDSTNGAMLVLSKQAGPLAKMFQDVNGLGFSLEGTGYTNQNIRWKAGAISGATDSHMLLNSSGNLTVTGVVTANSDIRLKSNIRPIENALDVVCSLQGKLYTKEQVDDQIGFIAQEVEEILPSVVHTDASEEKYKSINYASMVALLTEAIKQQQKQIDELKEKLNGN